MSVRHPKPQSLRNINNSNPTATQPKASAIAAHTPWSYLDGMLYLHGNCVGSLSMGHDKLICGLLNGHAELEVALDTVLWMHLYPDRVSGVHNSIEGVIRNALTKARQ